MTAKVIRAAMVASFFGAATVFGLDSDSLLRKIIVNNNIRPLETKQFEVTDKFRLGQALFFDPILSGNRDISCATCHVFACGTTDKIPMSIGPGGSGLGENRVASAGMALHPRNSLDLWNRDNNSVKAMFWDGRVEVLDPTSKRYRSPLEKELPVGLENLLAVQALFPLVTEDEMLGGRDSQRTGEMSPETSQPMNELVSETRDLEGFRRISTIHGLIMQRLIGSKSGKRSKTQESYRKLFENAYPAEVPSGFTIVHAANAIAHFEEFAFSTREVPWDKYVMGDTDAISQDAKNGAIIFFGKGRCSICHSGPLLSDFQYHSIGVRQIGPGVNIDGADFGRFNVTNDVRDMFKFRTPPLRNVTLTGPYFHDGEATTLSDAITQHLDPYQFVGKYEKSGAFTMNIEQIDAISPYLQMASYIDESEIPLIIAFLESLEDPASSLKKDIIPTRVPSRLPVDQHVSDSCQ